MLYTKCDAIFSVKKIKQKVVYWFKLVLMPLLHLKLDPGYTFYHLQKTTLLKGYKSMDKSDSNWS